MAEDTIADWLRNLDFYEYRDILIENNYFELLFPFLLIYAVLSTVLPLTSIFRNKDTGEPYRAVVVVISLVVSFFGVTFELSSGYTVGTLLSLMFPNISALTLGILTLYLIGSMLNHNFFRDMFRNDVSSYIFFLAGGIGLGAILFYLGIAFGIWDYDPLDIQSYWNVIIALIALVLGIVLVVIRVYGFGFLLLFIFGAFVFGPEQENILSLFIDPITFIFILVIAGLSWMLSPEEMKKKLEQDIEFGEITQERFGHRKDARTVQIGKDALKRNKKRYKELYGEEFRRP